MAGDVGPQPGAAARFRGFPRPCVVTDAQAGQRDSDPGELARRGERAAAAVGGDGEDGADEDGVGELVPGEQDGGVADDRRGQGAVGRVGQVEPEGEPRLRPTQLRRMSHRCGKTRLDGSFGGHHNVVCARSATVGLTV